jgi:hypothetical protein
MGALLEVNGQLHDPTALLPGKEPRYPLDRRLGEPQSRCRQYVKQFWRIRLFLPLQQERILPEKLKKKKKLHGLSPQANYTDRATAACRRSDCQLLRIKGATWSA